MSSQFVRRILPIILALLLSGCVDARVVVNLLPDGSGSFDLDIGYDQRAWPSLFGDPFAGWTRQAQLRAYSDPGLGPWSQPEIVVEGAHRRIRTEIFFTDIEKVQILGSDDGELFVALGFERSDDVPQVGLRVGVREKLGRPLPLPTPKQAGMEVSLSDALLSAIRQEIRPVIEGARLELVAAVPGVVEQADAFDEWEDREARIVADADRVALAMRERAGALLNEETLDRDPLVVRWREAPPRADEIQAHRERLDAALEWWGGVFPVRQPLPTHD